MSAIGFVGDIDPIEYGGGIIWGPSQHSPHGMLELIEPPLDEESDANARWRIYRIDLAPEVPSWIDVNAVANTMGIPRSQLLSGFTSPDTEARAFAYEAAIGYYGAYEFDQYPIEMTLAEVERRFNPVLNTLRRR